VIEKGGTFSYSLFDPKVVQKVVSKKVTKKCHFWPFLAIFWPFLDTLFDRFRGQKRAFWVKKGVQK